jgi:hypothetical protein
MQEQQMLMIHVRLLGATICEESHEGFALVLWNVRRLGHLPYTNFLRRSFVWMYTDLFLQAPGYLRNRQYDRYDG